MNNLLEKLNPAQKEAVLHTDGPLIIFAGAGTGKTRVITYRIAYLLQQGIHPYNILAVTFTNKAANEMRKRVTDIVGAASADAIRISTFHSFCLYLLSCEAKNFGINPNFIVYDAGEQINVIKECMKELKIDDKKFRPISISNKISRAKDDLTTPEEMLANCRAKGDFYNQTISSVYELYQKKLVSYNALDFGDLIMKTVFGLRKHPEILEKYQERFKYILVDEYQDTNHAQYILTKMLAAKYKNICVVGDDDQSIYSWRGADITNILDFEKDYADCKNVKLEQNYRSTPKILKRAWNVIKNNGGRVSKQLWTENNDAGEINVFQTFNENEEAERVVDTILINRQKGYELSDFAVFYRTNAQSRTIEDALRRQGIAYNIVGTLKFYERAEIKDIMAYLKLIHNPDDNVSFKRVVNVPKRGVGKTSLEKLENFANSKNISMYEALKFVGTDTIPKSSLMGLNSFKTIIEQNLRTKFNKTVKEIVISVIEDSGYIKEFENSPLPEDKSRVENIKEFVSAVDDFENRSADTTLAGYLAQSVLVSDMDSWQDEEKKVTLMTLHLAKGLEFKNVFIVGLNDGLFPLYGNNTEEEMEEERRLMYVGMTRAKENLYLLWTTQRTVYGKTDFSVPSRFLLEAGFSEQLTDRSARNVVRNTPFRQEKVRYIDLSDSSSDTDFGYEHAEKPEDSGPYKIGTEVVHDVFGKGRIVEKSGSGDNLKLVVAFSLGHRKKLLAKYANLKVI